MAKGKRSSGKGEGQYPITQANLDRKGKTNKKVKNNTMAAKYLTPKGKELKEKLFNKKENGWLRVDSEKENMIMKFSDEYIYFLNKGKTERECVAFTKKMLDENGFKCICEYEILNPGDKVYYINKERSKKLLLF